MCLVDVANGHGVHIGMPQELVEARSALPAEPYEADLQPVGGRDTESRGCHLHERPSAELRHQQPD